MDCKLLYLIRKLFSYSRKIEILKEIDQGFPNKAKCRVVTWSGNQGKSGKTKKNYKSQEKSGKIGSF